MRRSKDVATVVANSLDEPRAASLRELAARLFMRFGVFLACLVVVPMVALLVVAVVPPTYSSSAKLLIRYDHAGSSVFNEIAVPKGVFISGQANSELLKSTMLLGRVVERLGVREADVAQPAGQVLAAFLGKRLARASAHAAPLEDPIATQRLAEALKAGVDAKTLLKNRNEQQVNDELIEVSVRSPNPDKVAQITAQLCQEFIDEYYRMSEAEAQKAYDYLAKAEAGPYGERNAVANPIIASAANLVMDRELALTKLSATYSKDASEVIEARRELGRVRKLLAKLEADEAARFSDSVLKDKRQQAYTTLQLYKNRLIPISIIEQPLPPRHASRSARLAVAGLAGLIGGAVLGFALVMFLAAIDRRIYFPWEVEHEGGLSLVGSVGAVPKRHYSACGIASPPPEVCRGLVNALGGVDLSGGTGRVVLVTSPSSGEGKSFIAVGLAALLARDEGRRVLLLDGNLDGGSPACVFGERDNPGLADVIDDRVGPGEVIVPTSAPNLRLMCAGDLEDAVLPVDYEARLRAVLTELRVHFDVIVVDGASLLGSGCGERWATHADAVLVVVGAGVTRHETLDLAVAALRRAGARCLGAILNLRRYPVPRLLY